MCAESADTFDIITWIPNLAMNMVLGEASSIEGTPPTCDLWEFNYSNFGLKYVLGATYRLRILIFYGVTF